MVYLLVYTDLNTGTVLIKLVNLDKSIDKMMAQTELSIAITKIAFECPSCRKAIKKLMQNEAGTPEIIKNVASRDANPMTPEHTRTYSNDNNIITNL